MSYVYVAMKDDKIMCLCYIFSGNQKTPLTGLLKLGYHSKQITDQWKIAKKTPLLKKATQNQIKN